MAKQLSLNVGGATVDIGHILGLVFTDETQRVVDQDLKKGDDVELRLVCRVKSVKVDDKYDAHGNVSQTVKGFTLRVDEQQILSVNQEAWRFSGEESEDDAKQNAALKDAHDARTGDRAAGGDDQAEQALADATAAEAAKDPAEPDPGTTSGTDAGGKRHLAGVQS